MVHCCSIKKSLVNTYICIYLVTKHNQTNYLHINKILAYDFQQEEGVSVIG